MNTERFTGQKIATRWFALAAASLILLLTVFATLAVRAENEVADVSITKSVSSTTARPDDVVTYTLVVVYTGDNSATVTVSDDLHIGLTMDVASASAAVDATMVTGSSFTGSDAGTLAWTATMDKGASATITYAATLAAALVDGSEVGSPATAEVAATLSQATSEEATVTIDLAGPLKESEIRASRAYVSPEGTVNFIVRLANGSDDNINGMMEVTVPSIFTVTGATQIDRPNDRITVGNAGIAINGNTVTADFIAFDNTDSDLLSVSAILAADVPEGTKPTIDLEITDESGNTLARSTQIEVGAGGGGSGNVIYLPVVYKNYPPQPEAPFLEVSKDSNNDYTLSWTAEDPENGGTISYLLEESTDANFAAGTVTQVGNFTSTSHDIDNKSSGTYYYRVFTNERISSNKSVISFPSNAVQVVVGGGASGGIVSDVFTVDDDSISVGDCPNLSWNLTGINAVRVVLAKGFDPIATQGQDGDEAMVVPVCPSVDTEYLLYVTESDGDEVLYSRTVEVVNGPPTGDSCKDPYIEKFEAEDYTVANGEDAVISWEVYCIKELYMERGAGSGDRLGLKGEDSLTFGITGDTRFSLFLEPYVNYISTETIDDGDRFLAAITVEVE